MNDAPQRQMQAAAHLVDALKRLNVFDSDECRSRVDGDMSIGFEEAIPEIDLARAYGALVGTNPEILRRVPAPLLSALQNAAHSVYETANQILSFPVRDVDAPKKKRAILSNLQKHADETGKAVAVVLPFVKSDDELRSAISSDLTTLKEEVRTIAHRSVEQTEQKASELMQQSKEAAAAQKAVAGKLKEDAAEVESLLQVLSEKLGKAAVSETATFFNDEADRHHDLAFGWLVTTIVIGGLAIVAAVYSFAFASEQPIFNTFTAVHVSVAKIIVFSMLSVAFVWSARNHGAHCHNETLYRHRANALNTFEKFVGSTQNEHTRNMILLHASQAAFGQRKTGFDRAEDISGQAPITTILEKTLGKSVD